MKEYSTIQFREKYKDLNTTLFWLVQQALESIDYCSERWGTNNDLEKIWTIGKFNLRYHKDKKGVEQIQSVGTLMENNIHGKTGSGDCDCFTVFTIAMMLANRYDPNDIYIVLQGREKNRAVHIFTAYKKGNREFLYLDFTEPHFNTKRKYNYIEFVPITKFS